MVTYEERRVGVSGGGGGGEGGKEEGRKTTYFVDNHIPDCRRPQECSPVRELVRDDGHRVRVRQAEAKYARGLVCDGTKATTAAGAQHGGEQHLCHPYVGRLVIDGRGGGEGQRRPAREGLVVFGVVSRLDGAVHNGPALVQEGHGDGAGLAV